MSLPLLGLQFLSHRSEKSAKLNARVVGLRWRVRNQLGLDCTIIGEDQLVIRGQKKSIEYWENMDIQPYDANSDQHEWQFKSGPPSK